jgi:hypothetical protein
MTRQALQRRLRFNSSVCRSKGVQNDKPYVGLSETMVWPTINRIMQSWNGLPHRLTCWALSQLPSNWPKYQTILSMHDGYR